MITTTVEQSLIQRLDEVGKLIGETPLHPIKRVFQKAGVEIYAKLEWHQLGNSVKARSAYQIIRSALLEGKLEEKRLLDATSGNMGIAYAAIGSAMGIPVTLCLPSNASAERKLVLKSLGAELIYTDALSGLEGAEKEARRLFNAQPNRYYFADQYSNEHNWKAHYYHTAREIYWQTKGGITHFVSGLGTTGTFMGTSRKLKEVNPDIQCIALQPETSVHGLEGWKHLLSAGAPSIYEEGLVDKLQTIKTNDAYAMLKRFAEEEGMLISPSAAANLVGAIRIAESIERGIIVTVFPDDASKYGSLMHQLFSATSLN